jgi:HK97 family phage prohead protease
MHNLNIISNVNIINMKYKVKINGEIREVEAGDKIEASNSIQVKSVDKENKRLTMVGSTQDVDRHGDTVIQAGWDLKHFKKNPVILNSHNYNDATDVIARAENIRIEGKGKRAKLVMDWVFAVDENPKAKVIFDLYAGKFLHASSVGFIARKFAEDKDGNKDWWTIEEAELLEVSAVSVPANAMALAKAKGIDVDQLNQKDHEQDNGEDDEQDNEVPEDPPTQEDNEEGTAGDGDGDEDGSQEDEAGDGNDQGAGDDTQDESPQEKRKRLKAELAALEEELGPEDPAPGTTKHKVPYKSKVVKAVKSIETAERRKLKRVLKIVDGMLEADQEGARIEKKIGEKIRKRKINQAIRTLNKLR